MVMINTTLNEMNDLLKKKLSRKDFQELCFRYGMDLEGDGEYLNFEVTSDRIEIISKFSLADLFAQLMNIRVHRNENVLSKKFDARVKKTHRPFVNLLHVKLNQNAGENLADLLVMQDKFDKTVGRNRVAAAIGMFDFSKINSPITYEETDPKALFFVPLGVKSKRNYSEILEETEKGKMYGELLKDKPIVWKQKNGDIIALPPVINSDFASVTKETKTLLVDITGNNKDAVNSLTKALIFNLQFLGEVSVIKPAYVDKSIDTGFNLKQNNFFIDSSNVSTLLGIELSIKDISKILKAMDYKVEDEKNGLVVVPPFYRQDVIHQVDIVDDILRFYGVGKIKENSPTSYTFGSKLQNAETLEVIASTLLGFGYQELDLNILTTEETQFRKTGIKSENYAPLIGQKSAEITMASSNISGEILRFISNNLHKKFPQKLFDIGFVLERADVDVLFKNRLKLSLCYCGQDSNISEIRVALEKTLKESLGGGKLSIERTKDLDGFGEMFIRGRGGLVLWSGKKIGVMGEVHPRVLNEFKIELPVSLAEIYLDVLDL